MNKKYILTKSQAKEMLLVEDDMVHTFLNNPAFGLIGADHELKSLLKKIDNAFQLQKAGEAAQKLGHALAIMPFKDCLQKDILFVATKKTEKQE